MEPFSALLSKLSEVSTLSELNDLLDWEETDEAINEAQINESLPEEELIQQLDIIVSQDIESVSSYNNQLIETRNSHLEGDVHPGTNVDFIRQEVVLEDGTVIEGVFPKFEFVHETNLTSDLYKANDYQQQKFCNESLKEQVNSNLELKDKFTEEQLEQIENGDTPDGYTWHHHQEVGKMQLVESIIHRLTGHTGGRELWCGR